MADFDVAEDLKNKSDDELARWQAGWKQHGHHHILAQKEWERRARERQHELDLALMFKQVQWMKYSVVASVIAALLGAIVGAVLQASLH
jgi:hypothetical protein